MARSAELTVNHEAIRRWVEDKGGRPAAVKGTGRDEDPGILRIDFPDVSAEQSLEPIGWETFFEWFERNGLALLYRADDRFNKLISRRHKHIPESELERTGEIEDEGGRAITSEGGGVIEAEMAGGATSEGGGEDQREAEAAPRPAEEAEKVEPPPAQPALMKSKPGEEKTSGNKRHRAGEAGKKGRSVRSERRRKVSAVVLLEHQHRELEGMFDACERATMDDKQDALEELADAFTAHSQIEETLFYPTVYNDRTQRELRQAVEEHLLVKRVITDMLSLGVENEQFEAKLDVLRELVENHIKKEEKQLFALVKRLDRDALTTLGDMLETAYEEIMKGEPRKELRDQTGAPAELP